VKFVYTTVSLIRCGQEYRIGTARKMSVDIDAAPDLLLRIQQKLRIVKSIFGENSRTVTGRFRCFL